MLEAKRRRETTRAVALASADPHATVREPKLPGGSRESRLPRIPLGSALRDWRADGPRAPVVETVRISGSQEARRARAEGRERAFSRSGSEGPRELLRRARPRSLCAGARIGSVRGGVFWGRRWLAMEICSHV